MKHIVTILTLCTVMLLGVTSASAISLDVSALSSSNTRQIMATGHHIQKYSESEFEVSGQYVRSQDQPRS